MSSILARDGAIKSAIRRVRLTARARYWKFGIERARRRTSATYIGITGSSAKSTTSALLAHILERHGKVRKQIMRNMERAIVNAMRRVRPDDDYVVLELGVGMKGDMARFTEFVKPDVAIVTMVGIEHYTSFRGKEGVAEEKGRLVEAVTPGGFAVLNADDENVTGMASRTAERIVTFGRENDADYRAVSVSFRFPGPLVVDIASREGTHRIATCFIGEQFWLSITAAFAAARELGVPVETIAEACADFVPLQSRCKLFPVPDGPRFVLDTAKAPWETLGLSISAIASGDVPRRRIVIGQISDYAGSARPKYRDAYLAAREVADEVIFVGDNAHKHRASEEDRSAGRIVELTTARDLYDHLRATAIEGEVVLIKSSRNLHLERAALAFTNDVQCWEHKCGVSGNCFTCGLYEYPVQQHKEIRKRHKRERRARKLRALLARRAS